MKRYNELCKRVGIVLPRPKITKTGVEMTSLTLFRLEKFLFSTFNTSLCIENDEWVYQTTPKCFNVHYGVGEDRKEAICQLLLELLDKEIIKPEKLKEILG